MLRSEADQISPISLPPGSGTEPKRGRGRPRKLSAAQEQEIIALHGRKPASEIATIYGVQPDLIWQIWKRALGPRKDLRRDSIYLNAKKVETIKKQQFEIQEVAPDPIVDNGVLLLDLESHQCRWPIGVDVEGKRRFCGDRKLLKKSYCEEHHKQSISSVIPAFEYTVRETPADLLQFLETDEYMLNSQLFPSEEKMRIGDESFD